MTNKVTTTLKHLDSITQTLNEASDELSKQIVAIESALSKYDIGIEVWMELSEQAYFSCPDEKGRIHTPFTLVERLGYRKHGGKWGLIVDSCLEEFFPDDVEGCLLRYTSRKTRLAAIEKLPYLLEVLAEEAAKVNEEMVDKAAQARELAAVLRSGNSTQLVKEKVS